MMKVTYINFEELADKLGSVNYRRAINKVFPVAGALIRKGVSVETPVDTGTLQKGWRMITGNMSVTVQNRTKYGPFVNGGTRFITANPFMQRGYNKVEGQVRMLIFTALRKEL